MAFAVSEFASLNSMYAEQSTWTYILIQSVIQYVYIPASNITTQLLVIGCGTALEPDFLSIFFPRCMIHYCVVIYLEAWWIPMLELPTAHYFLSVKVWTAHWAAHYVI